ncbi:MAG: GGDEF domain-containing protein [Deltaproteobacteria bacterium]|nr:GGDEF domain-containing protein [Deltaproteobacteria bacterium]
MHEIKISDNAERMQALVREQVGKLVMGEGSLWLGSESLNALEAQKEEAVRRFAEKHPKLLEEAFESERANHPETWFEGGLGWIPLREMWMGGLFLWGVGPVSAAVLSRVEFLVRSLEISLESHRRYLEAKKLTFIDDVTHLHNARYLSIVTHQLVVSQKRFAVLFIDVDKFKGVNDKHGHLVGSALLVQMARILKNDLRPSDTVFRYGGDEFIAILHDQTREEAVEVAERLRQGVEKKRFLACGVEVRITISVGVALFPDDGASENAIVDSADKAMYQVKVSGRNSVFSFRNEKN